MNHRGSKTEEEAAKSSIAADLESDVAAVRINARRLRIERFRENVRRQEKLAQLGLESSQVEVAHVERQLAESRQKLEKLEDDGLELVTNVAVAFQAREADFRRNTELSAQQRHEREQQDDELTQERLDKVSELWNSVIKRSPSALQTHLGSQQELCDQLLAQKDAVIASLEAELKCMEDEYNVEVATHGQDTTLLIQRMKDQLAILRGAYARELEDIYAAMKEDMDETRARDQDVWQEKLDAIVALEEKRLANYIQTTDDHDRVLEQVHREDADEYRQVHSVIEKDVELLQQQLEQLKAACLLNTEKLDYNYQVLRRRDEESTITKSQQKRKLNKLQDTYNALKQKLWAQQHSQRAELQQLTADIRRLTDMLVDLGERNQHFVSVHSRQLHQIFQMTYDSCRAQLDKVIRADKVIHEQQLGLPFTPPDLDHLAPPEVKLNSAMDVVRQSLAAEPAGGGGPPAAAVIGPGSPLLRRLLLLLSDEAGFLVEDKLHRLLADIEREDGTLLRLDAVTAALGVRTQSDLEELCRHMVRYASPIPSRASFSSEALLPTAVSGSAPALSGIIRPPSPEPAGGDSSTGSGRSTDNDGSWSGGPGLGKPVLVTPDEVLRALSDFLDAHRAAAGAAAGGDGRPESAASRWARTPPPPIGARFWHQFLHVQPDSQRRLWHALSVGLQRYNTVLQERQALRLQVLHLEEQNRDLRQLLHSHLSKEMGGNG